jgi:TonB family protein
MRVGAQLLLTFLLNAFWQIALVVAFASAGDWLLRGTAARYRHTVWVAALGLAFFLPLLGPARLIKTRWLSQPQPVEIAAAPVFVSWSYSPDLDSSQPPATESPAVLQTSEPARRNFLTSGIPLNKRAAIFLLALYGLFLVYRAGQLVRAWRRTKKIVRSAFECGFSPPVTAIIRKCQTAIGVAGVRILCSASVPVPITVGIRQPLIILPERVLHNVDEEVLTSAIGHELVHVARRDYLANLIYEFVYLPLSFHPAAVLLRRRIKQTRELCCDEAVATKLLKPETYARSLVRLIGSAPIERHLAMDTTIGISESDILEVRIMSLLKKTKLTARRRRLLLITASLLLAAPCVAATSFALTFDIERQEPSVKPFAAKKVERQDQERLLVELKRAVIELKEKVQAAPASERAEAEARLREMQRNLEAHERAIRQFDGVREANEKRLAEVRETLAQLEKNRPANDAQMKELRAELAERERQTVDQEARLREIQAGVAEVQGQQKDRKARAIYRVEPEYTQDAREKQIAGSVLLSLTIDSAGLPQNIQVKRSLFPSLDRSAIEAAGKMRFQPALKDGQPVSQTISLEMHFQIEPGQYDPQRAAEDRLKREMAEREGNVAYAYRGQEFEMKRKRDLEDQGREERARRQAELTQGATLSMDRAIQIATSQVPGKVLACSLGRDGDKIFYHVVIITPEQVSLSTKEGTVTAQTNTTTYVWVSATDGQILKTEKEERRERSSNESEQRAPINGGVLNGKTTIMPMPPYPEIAKAARASGAVSVEVMVDETGHVIAAHAVSGHPLLQSAAVTAARQATFSPTRLNGEPVKVAGVLIYNFVAQ